MKLSRIIVVLLTLVTATDAWACNPIKMPPAYFDHEPNVPYRVFVWDEDMLLAACGGGYFPSPGGCSDRVSDDMWYIYLNATMQHAESECVLRHEKGHVNGWVHSPLSSNAGRPAK